MDKLKRIEKAVVELGGVWPAKTSQSQTNDFRGYYVGPLSDGLFWSAGDGSKRETICTYPEFMEARARLENKPTGWPEGADWLMQDSRGFWSFSEGSKPEPCAQAWHIDRAYGACARQGHVFGDWRQSLERRPQSKPDQETLNPEAQQAEAWLKVCETLTKVCPNWLDLDSRAEDCAVLAIEGLANRSPSTNNEHHDHKEGEGVKWGAGVDLPPVGIEVELTMPAQAFVDENGSSITVDAGFEVGISGRANFGNGEVAVFDGWCDGQWFFGFHKARAFRPIQSHRDKVIEAADKALGSRFTPDFQEDIFGGLYDAGLLNEKRGDQ